MWRNLKIFFDFPYFQLEKYPQEKALITKYNGKWKAISTQEYINKANAISRTLLRMASNQMIKLR